MQSLQAFIEANPVPFVFLALLITLWAVPWKGYALWKAARRGEKWWFVALLLINTMALLEILYIFIFSSGKKKK